MSNASDNGVINASISVINTYGCIDWPRCETREIDMAGWMFEKTEKNSNLTVLPTLALIVFLVLVCLKFYKWYKDRAKRKARGDVEFGDESEVNYGIIKEGDKDFAKVEIRSDTTSVYDTVNSFRVLGNGHATCVGAAPTYHDTVSSYKSLVLQRGDASQYNSVMSYKAFLKQLTQDKDLDVEVKLLENYPVKCKSTEHCVVVAEDCRGSFGAKSKLLPMSNLRPGADGKKKFRYRRASGEPYAMRKRSGSNPVYNRGHTGATSLPSIHYSVSSDSSNEEDSLSAFRTERRKAFECRCKKMSRSCSGGKLSKATKSLDEDPEANTTAKRKRHYSADGCSRFGRPLMGAGNFPYKISRAFQHELNNLRESISETDPKPEEHVCLATAQEDSSSENPDSSPSSCNSNISSDAVESESDDETQQITQISAISDCTTFQSNDFGSSAEQLSNQSEGISLDSYPLEKLSPCQPPYKYSPQENSAANPHSSISLDPSDGDGISKPSLSPQHKPYNSHFSDKDIQPADAQNRYSPSAAAHPLTPSSPSLSLLPKSKMSTTKQDKTVAGIDIEDSEDTDNSLASNPRRVKRFHVTSVQGSDLSSQKSDCRRSSSGGSMLNA